jgi:hypothetical protein
MGKVNEVWRGLAGGVVTNIKEAHADISASYAAILVQDAGWASPASNYDPWLSQQMSQQMPTVETESLVGLNPVEEGPTTEQDSLVGPPTAPETTASTDIGTTDPEAQAKPDIEASDPAPPPEPEPANDNDADIGPPGPGPDMEV